MSRAIVQQLFEIFQKLTAREQEEFLSKAGVYERQKERHQTANYDEYLSARLDVTETGRPACPHCGSLHVVKDGKHSGAQRFKCNDCRKRFGWSTGTMFSHSRKGLESWLKYANCFLEKKTLRECAKECGISLDTAFKWRHKLCDGLGQLHDSIELNGVVEADETYFAPNYKGAQKKFFEQLGIAPRRRSEPAKKRGLSKEKISVACGVNLKGKSTGVVCTRGRPTKRALLAAFQSKIRRSSTLVTDSLQAYSEVAKQYQLEHIKIGRNRHKNGIFNIQMINAYHGELKGMVNGRFKGVATKYLNNYVVYNNFVNFAKESTEEKMDILKGFVFTTHVTTLSHEISKRPSMPLLE